MPRITVGRVIAVAVIVLVVMLVVNTVLYAWITTPSS